MIFRFFKHSKLIKLVNYLDLSKPKNITINIYPTEMIRAKKNAHVVPIPPSK
jgi:hypothetical protein